MRNIVVIIGDSLNNTMGLIRSLGKCNADMYLFIASPSRWCNMTHSRYVKKYRLQTFTDFKELYPLLETIKNMPCKKYIICTFDKAAEWVDANESYLSTYFITPCRGSKLGNLFNKKEQCELAAECGLDVPNSFVYSTGEKINYVNISYPVLTKPLISSEGSKADIHICRNSEQLRKVIEEGQMPKSFIIQEFIEKEYEINCIGIRTDNECMIGCAIKKIRHYPDIYGAASFAQALSPDSFLINRMAINKFLEKSGYYGPFSIEFLHCKDKNYFMEVNFRNDGLAYTATCAGVNLYDAYINNKMTDTNNFRPIYMMNIGDDFRLLKQNGQLSIFKWLNQFFSSKCYIDIDFHDLKPVLWKPIYFILRRLPFIK